MSLALRHFTMLAGMAVIAGCGMFGGDDDELQPAELVEFAPTIDIRRLWTADIGGDAEFLRLSLKPASDGTRVYAASHDGRVSAFDPASGRRQWTVELDLDLSAGPGVGGDLVVVCGTDGAVIALNARDGAERWRADIGGESLSKPLVTGDLVIVQTVDSRMLALAAFDGSERWAVLEETPILTQRGTSSPVRVGQSIVGGFDNGRLVAVNVETGSTIWERLLAPPTGRSDIERLTDVDGEMAVVGQDIYAASYQGRVAAVAAESGNVLWANETSSFEGVSADWTSAYTTQQDGVLMSISRRNGAENWRQDMLLRREPTLPIPFNTTVVVGDFEGYLHFFSSASGDPVARVRVDSAAISTDPVVAGNRLLVQTDSGRLAAYAINQPQPERAQDIAGEDEGA